MRIPFIDGPRPINLNNQNMFAHMVLHYAMEDDVQSSAELISSSIGMFGLDWPFWAMAHWTDLLIMAAHRRNFTFTGYDTRGLGIAPMAFVADRNGPLVATNAGPGELIGSDAVPPVAVDVVNWFVCRERNDIAGARAIIERALSTPDSAGEFVPTVLTMAADNLIRLGGCPQ